MANTKKVENNKMASNVFSEFKETLLQSLKENPEHAIDAIHKRNTQIKCLLADIEHRQVVFKEISERYDTAIDEIEKLKSERDLFKASSERLKMEKDNLEKTSLQSHKMYTEKNDESVRLKKEKERLEKEINELDEELNKSKAHIAIEAFQKKKTVSYKLNQLVDKIPNEFIKSIFRFLFSQPVYKFTLFFIFMLLLFTSMFSWGPIIELVKQIKSIF